MRQQQRLEIIIVRFLFLFCMVVCSSNGQETLRRKVNEFTLALSPISSSTIAISAVLSSRASLGRDHIEDFLQSYLQTTTAFGSDPSSTIQVDTIGLTTPQVSVFVTSSAGAGDVPPSTDDDVIVELTIEGVVYFTDDSDKSQLPDEDGLLRVINDALTPTALLTIMKPIFPEVTKVALDTGLPDLTEEPTAAPPQTQPTTVSTPQPTPIATTASSVADGSNDSSGDNIVSIVEGEGEALEPDGSNGSSMGIIIGAVVGGLVAILVVVVFLTSRRRRRQNKGDEDDENLKDMDVWKAENVASNSTGINRGYEDDIDSFSPAKTEQMDDFDEEEQAQSHPRHHLHHPGLSKSLAKELPSLLTSSSPNHRIPSPMKDYDHQEEDANENKGASGIGGDYIDDDCASSLDFNVDDLLTISSCDDQSEYQTDRYGTRMIPVEPVESFERDSERHVIKKDMLSGVDGGPWKKNSNKFAKPTDNYNCALAPTDVSAATLAVKIRPDDGDDDSNEGRGSSSSSKKNLIPKIPWFGRNQSNTSSKGDQSDTPRHQQQRRRKSSDGAQSSDDDGTFGTGSDWDPDDISEGAPESDDGQGVFSQVSVENKDEQSLLHHSLRNESYKMQRLRTPPEEKTKKNSSRAPAKKYTMSNTDSTGGKIAPSSLYGVGLGGRKSVGRVMTPPPNMLGSNSGSFSSDEEPHQLVY